MPAVPHDQSVSQFLLSSNPDDVHPDTVILADFDDPEHSKITYAGLRNKASSYATILQREYGVKDGDVVCIYGYNSVSWIVMAHAVLWAGGCFW